MELSDTSVLVTGGGSGLGLACARRLVEAGARVTLMGRTAAKLERAVAELGDAAAPPDRVGPRRSRRSLSTPGGWWSTST